MYRFNLLKRPVLITIDEVVAKAAMSNNPDVRMILQNIEIAEERFIAPAIGEALYEDLISKKNLVITSSNQATTLALVNASLVADGKDPVSTLPIGSIVNAIEFITDPDYIALWNRFLWRLTAEAVDMMCTVPSWLQHTAQGQLMNKPAIIGSSGESASGSAKDVKFKMDVQMQERIDPLRARMEQWICLRKTAAPGALALYTKSCGDCENDTDGISVLRKSGFVFGAYDDPDDCDYCKRKGGTTW